jgi:hypothetical protein
VKFSTLFKHLLNIRSEQYNSEELKAISIIFSYHIYSIDYNINDIDSDLLIISQEEKEILKQSKDNIQYKEDNKIKYMDPLKIYKLPLSFAGSHKFHVEFNMLNKNTSEQIIQDDYKIKYLIKYNEISPTSIEIIICLQEDPSIVIYKFTDKLILLPKLEKNEVLFERKIHSKVRETYIIDYINKEILLIKKENINKSKGYITRLKIDPTIKKEDLTKYITFDMEAITDLNLLDQNGKSTIFDPIMISAYDFHHKKLYCETLSENWKIRENISTSFLDEKLNNLESLNNEETLRLNRIKSIKNFFIQFIQPKYHKFVLYAHNLSGFDGILILESLVYLSEDNGFRIEPLIRDNKIISIKIKFGKMKDNRYRYHITFHDSLLILLSSLEKLCKSILKDHPDVHKIKDKNLLMALL